MPTGSFSPLGGKTLYAERIAAESWSATRSARNLPGQIHLPKPNGMLQMSGKEGDFSVRKQFGLNWWPWFPYRWVSRIRNLPRSFSSVPDIQSCEPNIALNNCAFWYIMPFSCMLLLLTLGTPSGMGRFQRKESFQALLKVSSFVTSSMVGRRP